MIGIRTGRKNIIDFMKNEPFKITSWQTIRRWRRKGMPMATDWAGHPVIIESEVLSWYLKIFKP
jgi:hypothetical protein